VSGSIQAHLFPSRSIPHSSTPPSYRIKIFANGTVAKIISPRSLPIFTGWTQQRFLNCYPAASTSAGNRLLERAFDAPIRRFLESLSTSPSHDSRSLALARWQARALRVRSIRAYKLKKGTGRAALAGTHRCQNLGRLRAKFPNLIEYMQVITPLIRNLRLHTAPIFMVKLALDQLFTMLLFSIGRYKTPSAAFSAAPEHPGNPHRASGATPPRNHPHLRYYFLFVERDAAPQHLIWISPRRGSFPSSICNVRLLKRRVPSHNSRSFQQMTIIRPRQTLHSPKTEESRFLADHPKSAALYQALNLPSSAASP